jgi:hypothetical protein
MYNYKTLSKAQLIELVNSIENTLTSTLNEAEPASHTHSNQLISQLAFEAGYLKGGVKSVLMHISSLKSVSK